MQCLFWGPASTPAAVPIHKARLFRLHVRFPDSSYEKTHYVTPRRSSIMIKKTVPRAALFLPGAVEWRRSPRVRRIPPARLADTLSNDIPRKLTGRTVCTSATPPTPRTAVHLPSIWTSQALRRPIELACSHSWNDIGNLRDRLVDTIPRVT